MPEYIMLMKGGHDTAGWDAYIQLLVDTGLFRGGSALGNGICLQQSSPDRECATTGFMRFEANDIEQIKNLITKNPVYVAGNPIEILEIQSSG